MKTSVAITLIIVGGLLIITPALADFLHQRNVIAMMAQSGAGSVMLAGQMGELYRFGCWLTGTAMIGIAVLCSVLGEKKPRQSAEFVTQAA